MKLINKNLILSLVTIITLSACGGGSDESTTQTNNSNTSNPGISNNTTITGQFLSSNDTGKFYSTEQMPSYQQYGKNASHCYQSYNDYYFETENTMVFGNPDLPDTDFKQAAQWVENNFNTALTTMAISKAEYFSNRYSVRLVGLKHIRNQLSSRYYDTIDYPNNFDALTYDQQVDWATKTAKSLTKNEAVELLVNDPYSPFQTETQTVLEDKIYVCLHEKNTTNGWGEGSLSGITIGAPSLAIPHEVEKIVTHELIHTIQHALSANFEGLGLPRWYSEGQAVLLSGMEVAKKSDHNEYDPTLVVSYYDETGDQAIAYSHYGLAYQYLKDANGQPSIVNMMKDMKRITYNYSQQKNSTLKEFHGYVESFDKLMKQTNASTLTVQQYRDEYHALMSAY
ncbi:hypothetical protein FGD67_20130 [Colwellia sp. M166]|uniref:hypothetical protein n=1 Tax=Colwellia sp. M166 TaxID=2583805 RepID=UPI00211F37B7|nr:hypothetical protein [Colwellia sp. M166]UUO25256.1 hypothetical protein FGD67_20130 [Colwellia sp. M166]